MYLIKDVSLRVFLLVNIINDLVVLAVILDEGVRALINLGKYLRIVKKWGEWNG